MYGIINLRNGKLYKNNYRSLATARQTIINICWVSPVLNPADFLIVPAVG